MKRSEKEAEVRRLLETPGAVVQLPAGMSIAYAVTLPVEQLVNAMVSASKPEEGWGPEQPDKVKVYADQNGETWLSADGNYFAKVSYNEQTMEELPKRIKIAELVMAAYNATKEAEEAEADPSDPLTVALERVAAEEVAKLIEDAVNVAREETLKECVAKYASRYTREEFVAAEMQMALGPENTGDVEEIDPDALAAIRRRAEWNARAAERAGVIWRTPEASETILWQVGKTNYWPFKITADGQCWVMPDDSWQKHDDAHPAMKELARILVEQASKDSVVDYSSRVVKSATEAWKLAHPSKYEYEEDERGYEIARGEFSSGFTYGYRAGWWEARMDTLNPVCSPESVDDMTAHESKLRTNRPTLADTLAAIDEINKQFDQEIRWRRQLEKRIAEVEIGEANLQGLVDSISMAHVELRRHDVRITGLEKAVGAELHSLSEKLHAVEQAVREQLPVLKAPIGALSTERTEPLPATCCGCICHVCANGHGTGQHPHTVACHERVLGITPIPAPTPDAYPECPCKACQARRRKEEPAAGHVRIPTLPPSPQRSPSPIGEGSPETSHERLHRETFGYPYKKQESE